MPGLNIYIVEDNLFIAAVLKRIVGSLGHCVCGTSTSYERAVADLNKLDIDLVITDIMLEGKKNGIDLGKYIKSKLHIPFIFQSSITSADMIREALSTSPDAYLQKPVSKAMLCNAIADLPCLYRTKKLAGVCPR